jgi:Flp pilus assembly protein TadD/peroxiredoxin
VAGQGYLLVEGRGQAAALSQTPREVQLAPLEQSNDASVESIGRRMLLASRVPLPMLKYSPLDQRDDTARRIRSKGRPLLILLWSNTCPQCVSELKELTRGRQEWNQRSVDVLALSLDGLDKQRPEGPEDARRLLQDIGFPFEAGLVDASFLEKMEVVQEIICNRTLPDAVPVSFLLDTDSALAAVYRGRISSEEVFRDASDLDSTATRRRDLAVPLAGRWLSEPRLLSPRALAKLSERRGQLDDFVHYLHLDASFLRRQIDSSTSEEQRRTLTDQYVTDQLHLATALIKLRRPEEAMRHFHEVLRHDPAHVEALINLGALSARAGQLAAATDALTRAVKLAPGSESARTNLAAALGSSGRFQEARDQLQQVLASRPGSASAHAQMARWCLAEKHFAAAIDHLRQAVRLRPRDVRSQLQLGWLWATCPVDELRDGPGAVKLAKRLEQMSSGGDPLVLDVLAAGYAEAGDFSLAVTTCQRALRLLPLSEKEQRSIIQRRLRGYQAQQPFRSDDGKQTSN